MKVKKQHLELNRMTDWFQLRKGVCHSCILSLCLFNLYAEYIMRNAGLDEAGVSLSEKCKSKPQ